VYKDCRSRVLGYGVACAKMERKLCMTDKAVDTGGEPLGRLDGWEVDWTATQKDRQ
jgi:hypothetical protein